jgi:hypothetical protein
MLGLSLLAVEGHILAVMTKWLSTPITDDHLELFGATYLKVGGQVFESFNYHLMLRK